jgi:hypothetical protein
MQEKRSFLFKDVEIAAKLADFLGAAIRIWTHRESGIDQGEGEKTECD